MDIEAIVKKHTNKTGWAFAHDSCEKSMRAALTELAAGYEERLEVMADNLTELCVERDNLQKQIRLAAFELVDDREDAALARLNAALAAAPQQKKELD